MPSGIYPAGFPSDDDDDDFPDLASIIGMSAKNRKGLSQPQPQPRLEDDENSFQHFASQPAHTETPLRDSNRKDPLSRIRQYREHHEREEIDPKFNQHRPVPKPNNSQRTVIDLDLEDDLPSPVPMVGNRSRSFNSIPDPTFSSPSVPLNRPPLQRINTFPSSEQRRSTLQEREPFNPANIQDFSDDEEALRAAIAASLADMGGPQSSGYHAPPNPPPPKPPPVPPVQRKPAKNLSAFVCPDTLFQSSPSTSPAGTPKLKVSQVTQSAAEPLRSKVNTTSSRPVPVVRDDTRRLLEELEKVTTKPRKKRGSDESPEPKKKKAAKKQDENLPDNGEAPKPKSRSRLTQEEKVHSLPSMLCNANRTVVKLKNHASKQTKPPKRKRR